MPQYINKSAVKAELERRISLFKKEKKTEKWSVGASQINVVSLGARIAMLEEIISFLDTLEVKEEVLDRNDKTKLMQKCVKAAYKRGYDMGVLQTTNKVNHNTKDLEKENLPISNSLTKEGLVIFEDGSQAIITKIN